MLLCSTLLIITFYHIQARNFSLDCGRYPEGSQFIEHSQLSSYNGLLKAVLKFSTNILNDEINYCYMTTDRKTRSFIQSPTLRVYPGQKMTIKLLNQLPETNKVIMNITGMNYCLNKTATTSSTNLHFHGLEISPFCHEDDVLMTVVNSGEIFVYNVNIPTSQPPGLYWYHPHVHGLATTQTGGGASGALVIEGIEEVQPIVAGLFEQILVFRQSLARTFSLNYIEITNQPVQMNIKPNQTQFWRIVNTCVESDLILTLLYDGVVQNFTVVSQDGVAVGDGIASQTYETQSLNVVTGGRIEVIVTTPLEGQIAQLFNTFSYEPIFPVINLIALSDAPNPVHSIPLLDNTTLPSFVRISANLMLMTPAATHTLVFTQNTTIGNNLRWWITADNDNQQLFHINAKPSITSYQGTVEDWTIINNTPQNHNFHIHQMHFILLAMDGVTLPPNQQQYRDVVEVAGQQIDLANGNIISHNITIRMDFTREEVVGLFVYHCHILLHEDHGMMAIIEVKSVTVMPTSSPTPPSEPSNTISYGQGSNLRGCSDVRTLVGYGLFCLLLLALFVITFVVKRNSLSQ